MGVRVPPFACCSNGTASFKGEFRTANGIYCYPITIADQHTRFLLTCHGLLSTQTVTARPVFERAFREVAMLVLQTVLPSPAFRFVLGAPNRMSFKLEPGRPFLDGSG